MGVRKYGSGQPLVFSHIPKTAGTSLAAALNETLRPAVAVPGGIDTSLFGGYDDLEGISPIFRAGIFVTPEALPADAELVTAHVAPATTMARYPGADHLTVLRAPAVRVLSQWLHVRGLSEFSLRRWGPSGDAFRAGWQPVLGYLQDDQVAPTIDNTITRFLTWPHPALSRTEFISESDDDALVAAAIDRLDTFAHVNLVENSAFMDDISAWLGAELSQPRLNTRTSVRPSMQADLRTELDGETRELLGHRCRLDARIWKHVAAQVLPHADPVEVIEKALHKAVTRYNAVLRRPYDASLLRRAVEGAYELRSRVLRRPVRG